MEYATLGNTGLLVSKLCFGTMTFGDGRGLFKGISSVGQAGADEADIRPDRIAGISIGAINGALIAGNAPEARVRPAAPQ